MKVLALFLIVALIFEVNLLKHFRNHHRGCGAIRPTFQRVAKAKMYHRRLGPPCSFGACMKCTEMLLENPGVFRNQMILENSDGLRQRCELMLHISSCCTGDYPSFSAFF